MDAWPGTPDRVGWHLDEVVSTLVLDGNEIQLVERWSVVAELPLDELFLELPIAVGDQAAGAVLVVGGGEITDESWPAATADRQMVGLRLPRPLDPDEAYPIDLALCMPAVRKPGRHLFVPTVPCRRLSLRVHFAFPGAPVAVSRVDGSDTSAAAVLLVDGVGDVTTSYRDLRPGRAYGVAWPAPIPVAPVTVDSPA